MRHLQVLPETTLRHGALQAVLAPSAGGRISRLFSKADEAIINWLQPLDDSVRASGFQSTAWPKAGLYPLVPYSNRIQHGRFEWNGRAVQLPLHPGEAHALHGGSQQHAWTLVQHSKSSATMTYEHPPGEDGWPWSYRAEHLVTLDDQGLSLRLWVTNTSDEPMPCGAGFHPYFPACFADRLGFTATTVWPPDAQFLGTTPQAVTAADDYAVPRAVADTELTQYYSGWDGKARLSALDRASIQLTGSGSLQHLVLYRPAGRDFFCVEPVSHVSNAVHLAQQGHSGTGWFTLSPGQSLDYSLRMTLSAWGCPA